jgi:hypothetical protein
VNKKIYLSLIINSILSADIINNSEILHNSVKSFDNGGTKSAIDAYKDGIGAEIVDKPGVSTDNSAMNILTIKYGEEAKINNVTVVDQVIYGNSNPTSADLALAGRLTIDGAACNDGNAATTGETWLSGVCQGGIQSVFKSCNEILIAGNSVGDGIYTITPFGSNKQVYCDMTGGGWTLIDSFASNDTDIDNYNAAYGLSAINTTSELTSAGFSYYLSNINDIVSYSYTVKSGYMAFYYSGGPIGYISKILPNIGTQVKIKYGNWYGYGNSSIYLNSILKNRITLNSGASEFITTYNNGDELKITEDGITTIGSIWIK